MRDHLQPTRRPNHRQTSTGWAVAAVLLILAPTGRSAWADGPADWAHSPYRISIWLAVDDSARTQPNLENSLARFLQKRIDGTLRPIWDAELKIATGAERSLCFLPSESDGEELPDNAAGKDKLIWLGVEAVPEGYALKCHEFDVHLRRWGPMQTRTVQQGSFLPEACFDLLKTTFLPLVQVSAIEDNPEYVRLEFKGSGLPRFSQEQLFVSEGAAFVPLRRRTDRSGKLVPNGIQPVPWTFLTLASSESEWRGKVHSGVRRPFGATKRGLVEQIAIAAARAGTETEVRFHSRTDEEAGLGGYEVFRITSDGATELVGRTDRNGVIKIPATDESVSMLMLRSDGQVLARVPVVNGLKELQQMPIADNVTRLEAQAEAQVVREELVDLVARRAILVGRVKTMLKNGRVDDARTLMAELDAMPSPSVFDRRIDNAIRRTPKSDDPSVQKRIDALFSSTRDMLSKFLGTREIIELQNQVNSATAAPAAEETTSAEAAAPTS